MVIKMDKSEDFIKSGKKLISEYDGENFDKDMSEMQSIPIVEKWTNLMVDCFNPFPGHEDNNSWVIMEEIFYLE